MEESIKYLELIRPNWAPPSYLFGPVWSVLYVLIAISFSSVFYLVAKKKLPKSVAVPFVSNLVFNIAFTPLQFGLQNNFLASLDILLVLFTIVWMMFIIWPHKKWITLMQIPYFLWVSFATLLQITITFLNA